MSVRASGWAWDLGRRGILKGGQLLTMLRIADHADNEGVCWPGEKALAQYTGQGETTVRGHIKQLEAADLLHRERRNAKSGRGRAQDRILLHLDQPGKSAGSTDADQPAGDNVSTGKSAHDQPAGDVTALYREPSEEPSENQKEGDVVKHLFDVWRRETGRAKANLTDGRRRKVAARLAEGYKPELIDQAICNVARSPFHQGHNDRKRRYDDLTMICASGERLEGYAELAVPGGRPNARAVESVPSGLEPIDELWKEALARIHRAVSDPIFQMWLAPLRPLGVREGVVYVAANDGIRAWVERRYATLIREALDPDTKALEVRFADEPEEDSGGQAVAA